MTSPRPTNTKEPSISGTAKVGSTLQANRGEWAGEQPITYSYVWLRCNAQGDNCSEIQGATDTAYEVRDADTGRTIRVRVSARNDRGTTSAISNQTGVVGGGTPPPPTTGAIDAGSLQAAGDHMIVAQVRFSPNPVRSRTAPITARVQVTARGGRPVSGARVFMRATPRVVEGQTQITGGDGWVTITLVPNETFPQPRNGFNVQFFLKAYRASDPPLGGVAGYRLVQVPLAGLARMGGAAIVAAPPAVCGSARVGIAHRRSQAKGAAVDSDRVEGKAKETEGEIQQKWGEAKDKARDAWEDVKDKVEDIGDDAEDRVDERDDDDSVAERPASTS